MKKAKTLKIMIILLVIILIALLGILGIIYYNSTNKNLRYIYDTEVEGNIDIMPLNVAYTISEYKGNIDQRSIYKALYILANETIPKYRNMISKIDEDGISNYFKQNNIVIAKELGITEEKDFVSFISAIRGLKENNLILTEYVFHPDMADRKSGYLETILLIKYENNEKIGLYVRIPNSLNENVYAVSVSGGVEKKYLEYEYGSEFLNTDENEEVIEDVLFTPPGKVVQ